MKICEAPSCSGRQRPVAPEPLGAVRSHGATCWRTLPFLASMVTLAEDSPGEVASTEMEPADLVDWTMAMHRPPKAFREEPLSESWSVGSPLPTPMRRPEPLILNTTLLLVTGTRRSCASNTS